MGIKDNIGKRIRCEREKQKLSRENLCGLEDQLSVRQLDRIENGQSLPTLLKLEFIAKALKVDLRSLILEDDVRIPDEYYQLKYQLIKSPSYGDSNRLTKKSELIEKIYENYFQILPEEELLTLDLLDRLNEYALNKNILSTSVIYEDLFKQLLLKEKFFLNDLLLAYYYFRQCEKDDYNVTKFNRLVSLVLRQSISTDDIYNFELLGAISAITSVHVAHQNYRELKKLTDRMNEIIVKTQSQFARPVTLMLEAKFSIYVKNDLVKGGELYELAILLSQGNNDKILEQNLILEKEKDNIF